MAEGISPHDLVPMDLFCGTENIKIDVVYADAKHPENIFGAAVYDPNARMILHRDLARIVILCARDLNEKHGWRLVLKDGLRTVEAQERLMETEIVRRNPQWLEEPRLLSAPGQGAHPRGMAIDVSVEDEHGHNVDMGTVFDGMVAESARGYDGFATDILRNRQLLEDSFMKAAARLSLPLLPLPSEWWDFRFPMTYHGQYVALHDRDLPPPLKMGADRAADEAWEAQFQALAKSILISL